MPKGGDLLEVRLKFKVSRRLYPTPELRDEAVNRARQHFIATGQEIEGVQVIGEWRNPLRSVNSWKSTEDTGQSLGGFHDSLNIGSSNLGYKLLDAEEPVFYGPGPLPPESIRSSAMKLYHAAVRAILGKHPKWSYARGRKSYRRWKR